MALPAKENWIIELNAAVGPQLRKILRERIIQTDLAPGSPLSESEIAKVYSISRQPVREAFIKLSEEGLVEIRPQRGTFVRKISTSDVMDARFVREAVEADIVKLLAESPRQEVVDVLRDLIAQQKEAARGDHLRFMELDERFHRHLSASAGKNGVWRVIEESKSQMDRVRFLSTMQFPMDRLVEQHNAIVDAIALGDAAAAENAMRAHLREVLKDLPKVAESAPDYFEP